MSFVRRQYFVRFWFVNSSLLLFNRNTNKRMKFIKYILYILISLIRIYIYVHSYTQLLFFSSNGNPIISTATDAFNFTNHKIPTNESPFFVFVMKIKITEYHLFGCSNDKQFFFLRFAKLFKLQSRIDQKLYSFFFPINNTARSKIK